MITARAVRRVVIAVCVVGIAGMIVGSIADDNDVALTFGLLTAAAVACLMVASAVAGAPGGTDDEVQGQRVERLISELVAAGADEAQVRALVAEAVRLGRGRAGAEVHGGRTPHPG